MSGTGRRGWVPAILVAILTAWAGAPAVAQELPVKRGPAQAEAEPCPPATRPSAPSASAMREASQLAAEGTRAALVGDEARALDRLRQAAQLDPTAAPIAYRLARVLDDTGDGGAALREYCRYLGLAGNSPEAPEVRERVAALAPRPARSLDSGAIRSFRQGVRELEAGAAREALESFNAAIVAEPSWADAYYNRALALAALGATDQAAADLNAYLRFAPEALDRAAIQAAVRRLRPSPAPAPASVLAAGLALPGGGQFVTGRPLMGMGVLAGAGGAVALGVLSRRVEVRCLAPPENGHCPPDDVLDERVERPYLVPSILGAAVLSVVAAWEGYRWVRGRRPAANRPAQSRSDVSGHQRLQPAIMPDASGLRIEWVLRL